MKSIYKRIDKETYNWALNSSCRRFTYNNKNTRKLRREMRKHARKRINRFMLKEEF